MDAADEEQYFNVINIPGGKEKKELLQCCQQLRQLCQQQGWPCPETETVATGHRNRWKVPVHEGIASVTTDEGETHRVTALSTSSRVAMQLAERALLFALVPSTCTTPQHVADHLKAHQRQSKKESAKKRQHKREEVLLSVFPDCSTMEEVRQKLSQGWQRQPAKKRGLTEMEGGADSSSAYLDGSEIADIEAARGERNRKRRRTGSRPPRVLK
eukprot:NODE_3751_length_923_cov_23.583524_g3449_i0.p1 GENE.NODE_3751_length_923_cov_23.583524_g3449_i0~~NODE_3751_length_923_cov_23.583524_g3449_i0.p1  ORF type:complete len:214 (-),score=45.09 NODE_3751_length_923_cov_23.583524_g3449_i0:130-771(-)